VSKSIRQRIIDKSAELVELLADASAIKALPPTICQKLINEICMMVDVANELRWLKEHHPKADVLLNMKELINSGALTECEVVDALIARGLTHKVAGKFTPERERIVSVRERRVRFPPKARDPYNRIFFSR